MTKPEDRPELDMPFDEALRRFIQADPKELPEEKQGEKRKARKAPAKPR